MGSQSGASDSNTGRIRPNMEGLRFAIPAKLSTKPENKVTSVHTEGHRETKKVTTTNSMPQAVSYKWVTAKVSLTDVNHKKVPWIALSRWDSRDVEEACQAYIPVYKYNGNRTRKDWGFWCPKLIEQKPKVFTSFLPQSICIQQWVPTSYPCNVEALCNTWQVRRLVKDWWNCVKYNKRLLNSTLPVSTESSSNVSPSEFCWFSGGWDDPLGSGVKSRTVVSTNFTASNLTPSFPCCSWIPKS
jgi:hypothetical protein